MSVKKCAAVDVSPWVVFDNSQICYTWPASGPFLQPSRRYPSACNRSKVERSGANDFVRVGGPRLKFGVGVSLCDEASDARPVPPASTNLFIYRLSFF
jgi:hypothetical protein